MMRFLFYAALAYFLWHTIKRLFLGGASRRIESNQKDKLTKDLSSGIDYNNIDDAEYEDIDKEDK